MTAVNTKLNQNQSFYSKPKSPVDDIVEKAGETIRRTNLQNAAKTPSGAAVAALKYLATDAIAANVLPPEVNILNAKAAIKQYSK